VVIAELAETGRDAERAIRSEGGEALFVETDVAVREGAVQEMDVGTWDRTIAVNLRGAFLTPSLPAPGE
jgi:NAD(P)-dependent dehydrogenase (short-subunit alcohol dehydrogenase family)